MEIRKLDLSDDKEMLFVENLYIDSFPLSERRPVEEMLDLYKDNSIFTISLTIEDGKPVGFLTFWDLGEFIFAEHFAISPEFRNGGYGRKVMDLFLANIIKPLILEVELPTTILAERRIGFYQRIGFKLWQNVQYQQPAYYEDGNAVPMKLMSYGDIEVEKELMKIRGKLYEVVYDC